MPARVATRGTTLYELMVVLGIMSILTTIAIAYSGSFWRDQALRDVTREVSGCLARARAAAIHYGQASHVEFRTSGTPRIVGFFDRPVLGQRNNRWAAEDRATGSADYPYNRNPICSYPDARADPFPVQITISSPNLTTANNRLVAVFDNRGFSQTINAAPTPFVVCVRDTGLNKIRAVQVSIAGAQRVLTENDLALLPAGTCP